jgi:hypothetical protein
VPIDESHMAIPLRSMTNCGNEHSGMSNSTFCCGFNSGRRTGCSCAMTDYSASSWVDLAPSKMRSTNYFCPHKFLLTVYISFDLDLPVDCDDEYWDHPDPEKRFKQPPNKPSSVISFILYIKLQQVYAFSIRTIVSHTLNSASEPIQI